MKRSEINKAIEGALGLFDEHKFRLPAWGYWTPEEWRARLQKGDGHGPLADIVNAELGWDLCEFGRNDFVHQGLLLFTIRNGMPKGKRPSAVHGPKQYCEKIMMSMDRQKCLMHFHWNKMEDIINRGGAPLHIQLYRADKATEEFDTTSSVAVSIDGEEHVVPAGGSVVLMPGQSITLAPYVYHSFWPEGGSTMIGEVSLVNDDHTDNRFGEAGIGRFPHIIEDEPARHWLASDVTRFAQSCQKAH